MSSCTIAGLPGVRLSSVAWADYDSDGRVDLLITGASTSGRVKQLWRNFLAGVNALPSAPAGLFVTPSATEAVLNWAPASDAQTPAGGLTYNVRVGTTPSAADIVSPMSLSSGFRLAPQRGNAEQRMFMRVSVELGQTYYWSVQAVDNAHAGGPFAPERSFTLNSVLTPPDGMAVAGDRNGDGVVDQNELNTVLKTYWQTSPPNMESVSSSSNTLFRFGVSNLSNLNFRVLASTNLALPLIDWTDIGPAALQYQFNDPDAASYPARFYQLIWP